jgi:hypothetical protein
LKLRGTLLGGYTAVRVHRLNRVTPAAEDSIAGGYKYEFFAIPVGYSSNRG